MLKNNEISMKSEHKIAFLQTDENAHLRPSCIQPTIRNASHPGVL